jgi:hypothetical protein
LDIVHRPVFISKYNVSETEFIPRTVVFWNKNRMMDNVQKHNNCISIPLPQTFRSYVRNAVYLDSVRCPSKLYKSTIPTTIAVNTYPISWGSVSLKGELRCHTWIPHTPTDNSCWWSPLPLRKSAMVFLLADSLEPGIKPAR